MRDRGSAFAQSNLDLVLSYYRTGKRSSEQIFVLVNRARLERRKNVIGQEFLPQVFNYNLAGAGLISLLDNGLYIIPLTYVTNHSDHVIGVILLEPGNDD